MSLIGDISDPKKDAAAIEPVLDELEAKLVDAVVARIIPELEAMFKRLIDNALGRAGSACGIIAR
jgi:hypothetical protein